MLKKSLRVPKTTVHRANGPEHNRLPPKRGAKPQLFTRFTTVPSCSFPSFIRYPRRADRFPSSRRGKVDAMNKNTSPQSRPSVRSRSSARGRGPQSKSAARVASRVEASAEARRSKGPGTSRLRRMLWLVGIPHLVFVLSIVAVALAALLLTSAPLGWLPTTVAESWMVFNLAPVSAGGIDISLVPLVPALLLGWVIAFRIRKALAHKVSINDLLVLLACTLGIPLVLTGIAWLMIWDAGKVYDVAPPSFLATLPRMLVLHLLALAIGMGPRLWKALARRYNVTPVLVDAVRTATHFLLTLAAGAAILLLALLVVGWSRQGELLSAYPHLDGWGLTALILISILYLPNALIDAAGVLVGAELQISDASVSLFDTHLIPLPPVPLFGLIPAETGDWTIALMLIAAIAAALVCWKRRPGFTHVGAATVATAILALIGAYLAGGVLGFYDYIGLHVWLAAGLAALWFGAIALAFAAAFALAAWRAARGEAQPEEEPASSDAAEDDDTEADDEAESDEDAAEDVDEDSEADDEELGTAVPYSEYLKEFSEDSQKDQDSD